MSVPRSRSAPHISSATLTKISAATASPEPSESHYHVRPLLSRHQSAVVISGSSHHLVPAYTPRVEREDPFSLSGFFPTNFAALEHPDADQEWDWLRATDEDEDEDGGAFRSGPVSPISESDDEWPIHTPCSLHDEDALTGAAIKREDKLGILTLSGMSRSCLLSLRDVRMSSAHACPSAPVLLAIDTFSLPPRGDELYVDDHLLSPYSQTGDPLDADAVYDALRALRTAHSLPQESAVYVKDDSAALHELFSPENDVDDKVKVEDGWGALVSWGVSSVVDYLSPV